MATSKGTRSLPRTVLITFLFLLLSVGHSQAATNRYVEDFSTTQYLDAARTTAWWNTTSGDLELFPFSMQGVGSYPASGDTRRIVIDGDFAYVADNCCVHILDISDPANPTVAAGTSSLFGEATDLVLAGNFLYVAYGTDGLKVYDVSTHNLFAVGTWLIPTVLARSVAVSGNHAYVGIAGTQSGLRVINISDPTNPLLVGSVTGSSATSAITVDGNLSFSVGGNSLLVVDISNPSSPSFVSGFAVGGVASDVAVSGDLLYVAAGGITQNLKVLDISNPAAPTQVGSYATGDVARGVTMFGNFAFVTNGSGSIMLLDISDPAAIVLVDSYLTPGEAWSAAIHGDHAYVADGSAGVQIVRHGRLFQPPNLAGSVQTPDVAFHMAVSGSYAYVADLASGLQVLDISAPSAPVIVNSVATVDKARGVAVAGNFAYVAARAAGLKVIDIKDPANPFVVATLSIGSDTWKAAVEGDTLYLLGPLGGMGVVDISDPANPSFVISFTTPGNARDLAVSGNLIYLADFSGGMNIVDVTNPRVPALVGSFPTPKVANDVAVADDYAYVAVESTAVQVVDVSNPASPSLAGSYPMNTKLLGITIEGDYAFVAAADSGLIVLDVSDPANPARLARYDTPDRARHIEIHGDYALVSDDSSGVQVIQVFQREFILEDNVAQSLRVNQTDDDIIRVRANADVPMQIADLSASVDTGTTWTLWPYDDVWRKPPAPGNVLLWRMSLLWGGLPNFMSPTVNSLQLDWLYRFAVVDSVVDVRNDQGGWIRIHATRSGYDFADELLSPIVTYYVWRRVDNVATVRSLAAEGKRLADASLSDGTGGDPSRGSGARLEPGTGLEPGTRLTSGARLPADLPLIEWEGRFFVRSSPRLLAGGFPPGTWEVVTSFPGVQQDQYIHTASTAADSSGSGVPYFVYVVTAHTPTPSVWYASPPDSGYSVDNLLPTVPQEFTVSYFTGGGNRLTWQPSSDPDFQLFRIYRSTDPNFTPAPGDLVHSTSANGWFDPDFDGWNVYYKVSAVDDTGNESAPASPATATGVKDLVIPARFALHQNVPNPFNPTTLIRYDVPIGGGRVTLMIYDATGRLTRTLVDRTETPGQKRVEWNGRNASGQQVATGVYFCRLKAPGFERTRKMVLLR